MTWTCDNFNRAVINSTSTTSENTESVGQSRQMSCHAFPQPETDSFLPFPSPSTAMVFIASLSGETNAEFDGNYGDRCVRFLFAIEALRCRQS